MAKQILINLDIETNEGVKSIGDVNKEVKTTLKTMRELEDASDAINEALKDTEIGTEEYKKLSKELIKVNTEIKNQELALEALDHEQVASEIKSVVGGLTDMAGGLALVGASGEKMEELVQTFAQVEGASKIVTGAMEGYQSMMKLSGTITASLTKVQTALAAAQLKGGITAKAAAVGMRILNAVMNANPVFLIITGVTALVGAIAWFVTSTDEAAEAAKRLNTQLEIQNQRIESNRRQREQSQELEQNELKNKEEILKANIKLLESQGSLSSAEKERLTNLKSQLEEVGDAQRNLDNEEIITQAGENVSRLTTQFELLEQQIRATEEEDGIDDINYSGPIAQAVALKKSFEDINEEFTRTGNAEKYKENLNELTNQLENTQARFTQLGTQLGDAEKEKWDEGTETLQGIRDAIGDVNQNFIDLETSVADSKTAEELKSIEEQTEANRKASEAAKRAAQKALQARKEALQEINDLLSRSASAEEKLERIRISAINNVSKRQQEQLNNEYGAERDRIIENAVKREIAALEKKFIDGEISEEEFMQTRQEIVANGVDNLTAEEQKYLDALKEQNEEAKRIIRERAQYEKRINVETTELIIAETEQMELQAAMEAELRTAETEEEKLAIRRRYASKRAALINKVLQEQLDVLAAEEEQALAQAETQEERLRIQAEFEQKRVQMRKDANDKIQESDKSTSEQGQHQLQKWAQEAQKVFAKIQAVVSQGTQTLSMAFQEMNARADAEREERFNKANETLEAQLANREITEQEYNDAKLAMDAKLAEEEKQAKLKQFKQEKALRITTGIMNTAGAVLQALASSPPPTSIILASIAGALGAAQVGIIASQQFRAARGGVVPGEPSKIDSVDAKLAPGEAVINSESSSMFPTLLSEINKAGGGKPLAPEAVTSLSSGGGGGNIFQKNTGPNAPVRAYVVENDISESQSRVERMRRSAEF